MYTKSESFFMSVPESTPNIPLNLLREKLEKFLAGVFVENRDCFFDQLVLRQVLTLETIF